MKILLLILVVFATSGISNARPPEVTAKLSKVEIIEITKDKIRLKVSGEIFFGDVGILNSEEQNKIKKIDSLKMASAELIIYSENQPVKWDKIIGYFEGLKSSQEAVIEIHGSHEVLIQYGKVQRLNATGVVGLIDPTERVAADGAE